MTSVADARALSVRGLSKSYGGTTALREVDLDVQPGELRGLLGLNGAGKTTLLRILFGLIRPDEGAVTLLGQRLDPQRSTPVEGVAGFVEEPAFYPYLTGRANLELLAGLDDRPTSGIAEALELVGLQKRAGDRVGSYSTGMRQRLGIAAALLREPRLLLLDEPTSGLDPAGIRATTALLGELSARGVAVILSSHLIGELEAICHSYTILREGYVVWEGSASGLAAEAPGSAYAMGVSDEGRALELAERCDGVDVSTSLGLPGVRLIARSGPELDSYVAALVAAGVSIRRLELLVSPLESMFFAMTADAGKPVEEPLPPVPVEGAAR